MDCQTMILSDEYADLLLDFEPPSSLVQRQNSCSIEIDEALTLFYARRTERIPLPISQYRYLYLPTLYSNIPFEYSTDNELLFTGAERSGISSVTRPPLSLSGLGTRIAIIDSGIDYSAPDFLNPDGTSRILAIWDQTITNGPSPPGLPYGTLYTKEQLDAALRSSNPFEIVPTRDSASGHGTNLASIAAGSIDGIAPLASLIVVKLKPAKQYLKDYFSIPPDVMCYEEPDLIAALKFVDTYREVFYSPLTILLGIGTTYGDHDGNSLFEQYISRLCMQPNLSVICAGGNEGNKAHHYRGSFTGRETETQTIEFIVPDENPGFLLQFYGSLTNRFTLSVRSPLGEQLDSISFDLQRSTHYNFLYDQTTLTVDSLLSEQFSGEEAIYMHFRSPSAGLWQIMVHPEEINANAVYDLWLPMDTMLYSPIMFTSPTPFITLTAPSMAQNCICVSAYHNIEGLILPSSGRGYLKNGEIKPDIAAPGTNISVSNNTLGGSMAAAALTCGACALLLEWAVVNGRYPLISGIQLRNQFRQGARRPAGEEYPNREHGYGYLDLARTIERFR